MDSLTDNHQITRLDIVDTGRRGRWSDEEKRRIVEERLSGPRLASGAARRHGISNQLLFFRRKAYRDGRLGDVAFVPAAVVPEPPEKASGAGGGQIEILCCRGRSASPFVAGRSVGIRFRGNPAPGDGIPQCV
jgi:transposase